jgi:hypothetical protein
MALKRIRFVWGAPPFPGGRWRAALFNLQRLPDPRRPAVPADAPPAYWRAYLHHALNLSVRGLLVWGACAAVLAYFAGAAALLHRWQRANPHNRVTYADLVLPSRWSRVERIRAEGLIARGREALAYHRLAEGFGLLRAGLDRKPDDHPARLELARLYTALRLRPQAEKLLLDGLAHGYPGREHLDFAFALAADADRPADRVALVLAARRALDSAPASQAPAADAAWLDQQLVRALLADRREAEALAVLARSFPPEHAFRRETGITRLLDSRRPAEAAAAAEAWAADAPRAREPLRLLARARRLLDDHPAMDAALARLRALDPAQPEPLLYALAQHHLADRPDAASAALDDLLLRHGSRPATYVKLAAALLELRHSAGLDRVETELNERGLSTRPVLWARLQLAVVEKNWPAVLAHAEAVRASPGPPHKDSSLAWLDTASRLARACLDGASGTQASLVEIAADRPGTLRFYQILLESLLDAGQAATARQILTLAEGPYPAARSIVALRSRIESALAAAAPPPAPDRPAPSPELRSADALADAFSARVAQGDAEGALALLAAARRARPPWFAAAEPRLDAAELRVRARGEDPLRLRLLVRGALAHDTRAPEELLRLAREIFPENPRHRAHALLIVKEILRHSPEHREAIAQLATWEPRAALATLDAEP